MRIIKSNHSGLAFRFFQVGNICYGLELVYQEWITTEWVVFMGIPLAPVGSWTVYGTHDRWGFTILSKSEEYEMERREGLHWPQVIRGYSITAFVAVVLFALPYVADWFAQK